MRARSSGCRSTPLRSPGASAVIYGGVEARGIVFDGVADALAVPGTDLRLFGKPESFAKRRMGVALARHPDLEKARVNAKLAASKVKPRVARRTGKRRRLRSTSRRRTGPA
jgi:phosphoribosylglycinamide formyltransferase 2